MALRWLRGVPAGAISPAPPTPATATPGGGGDGPRLAVQRAVRASRVGAGGGRRPTRRERVGVGHQRERGPLVSTGTGNG